MGNDEKEILACYRMRATCQKEGTKKDRKTYFASYAMRREGDVVLVYYQDKPALYARIEAIAPDTKKDWYQVRLLLLTIPPKTVTWLLREEYINGASFTMGGQAIQLEEVRGEQPEEGLGTSNQPSDQKGKGAKIISLKRKDADHSH